MGDRFRIDWENLKPLPRRRGDQGATREDLAERKFNMGKAKHKGRCDHLPIIAAFIESLADRCEALAFQAGVGGVETAGHLISYLAEYPRDLEPFLTGGFLELPPLWLEHGRLTYHGRDGKIHHPRDARHSRIIAALKDTPNDR